MTQGHESIPFEPKSVENYRQISIRVTDPKMLKWLRSLFDRRFSLDELLEWLHGNLTFSKGEIERHSDPSEILAYGRGRCSEFSVLFTALCLAHDYRARLILDMSDHVWTEVWNPQQERWAHVDPSERKIDDPMMYERDWKKSLKEVYALENGQVENVTVNYKLHC